MSRYIDFHTKPSFAQTSAQTRISQECPRFQEASRAAPISVGHATRRPITGCQHTHIAAESTRTKTQPSVAARALPSRATFSSRSHVAALPTLFPALEESPVPETAQERPLGTRKRRYIGDANTSNIQQAQINSARAEGTRAGNDSLNRLGSEG